MRENENTFSIEAAKRLDQLDKRERVLATHNLGIIAAQNGYLRTERVLNELDLALLSLCHSQPQPKPQR